MAVHKKQPALLAYGQHDTHYTFIPGYLRAHVIVDAYRIWHIIQRGFHPFPHLCISHAGQHGPWAKPLRLSVARFHRQMH
ncbi:hypothetical protein D3C80_1912170 [compost metagenome]